MLTSCGALLTAGVALAGATHDDQLLVMVTPVVLLFAIVTMQQIPALQVILAAVTAHFVLIAIGWDGTEAQDWDILITVAAALAGIFGLRNRPWLKERVTMPTPPRQDREVTSPPAAKPVHVIEMARPYQGAISLGPELSARLGKRQEEVIRLTLEGLTARAIGERLGIGARTVETHRAKAYRQLGIHSMAELIEAILRPPPA